MTWRALPIVAAAAVLAGGPSLVPDPARAAAAPSSAAAPSPAATRTAQLERQAEINDELKTLRGQLSEASADEAELLGRLDEVKARKESLDVRVAEVDAEVEAVQEEATAAEAKLETVQSEFVRAQSQLALEKEALARERRRMRDRAVAAYIANPSSNAAELMLRARDMRQIAATAGYLRTVVEVQSQAVRRYTTRRDATDVLRTSVEVQKDAAMRQRNVVVNRLSDLEAVRAERQRVRDELATEEARHAELLEEVRRRRADFEAEIATLKTESNAVGALLKGLVAWPGTAAVQGSAALVAPLAGARYSSMFGPRLHPIFATVRMHEGLDFAAPSGTPIRSAAAGTVVSSGTRGGYGIATIVDHGGGVATLYAHQRETFVTAGSAVAAGQVIGAVGSTGFSTGPHLHFEVRVSGAPVDPLLYLAR